MDPGKLFDPKQLAELEAKLQETRSRLEKIVKDHPLTSVVVAVGLGYVLARFLRRSKR
ncbi:MAG TPA: hypothetical protein VNJ01_13420 [Bacteriovoracaceae bacterium]|nr:hypothetical protein [Bacteriovoracaceae bacterium]